MPIIVNQSATNIPPDIFAPIKSAGSFYAIQPYPKEAAAIQIFRDTIDGFKITPYRLGKLLGMTNCGLVYHWANGESKPSPYYCTLLIKLYQEVLFHGLNISLVDEIHWADGEIIYKGMANDKGRYGVPPGQRPLSKNQSDHRGAVAKFYNQSPG